MLALSVMISFAALLFTACTEENNYITYAPADWQGPLIEWRSAPEAEVRGTVGLDVNVTDSSAISRVRLYVNGREDQTLTSAPYRFEIITDSLPDGVHVCEVRAWDEHGNMGISPILRIHVANSVAQGPRVIWVPDEFALIQAAINAAADFDTIRVRDGIYYETLNTFGKGIWLESENGPLRCTIDNAYANNAFLIAPCQVAVTIRGFLLQGSGYLISLKEGSQANFYNNIVVSDSGDGTVFALNCGGEIVNNIFFGSRYGVQIGYMWGNFFNNIIRDVINVAFWNLSTLRNPLVYGYNLFWNNGQNYNDRFPPGQGDVEADPMLDMVNGAPLPGSPVVDTGNPEINDRNGSRSDIGPFGGPYTY